MELRSCRAGWVGSGAGWCGVRSGGVVTIDSVLALPGLGLRLVAGEGGRRNPVRWVHVSEVEDPTPWLRGGELLLTTGLAIGDADRFGPYVRRLAAAGLAGLGFGIEFAHARTPEPLRAAADAAGLPVIEIGVDTPFMAISEAVSSGLSAERQEELGRVLRAQRTLTRAMLDHGAAALLGELAAALGCWAAHTDPSGAAREAAPPEAASRVAPVVPDLRRCLAQRQPSAVSAITPDEHVMAHPLGAPGRVRGFVVIGRPSPFTGYDRMVLSVAVSLLAVQAEQQHRAAVRDRRTRAGVLRRAFSGELSPSALAEHAAGWGLDPSAIRVSVLDAPDGGVDDLVDAVDALLSSGHPGAAQVDGTRIRILAAPDADPALISLVTAARTGATPNDRPGDRSGAHPDGAPSGGTDRRTDVATRDRPDESPRRRPGGGTDSGTGDGTGGGTGGGGVGTGGRVDDRTGGRRGDGAGGPSAGGTGGGEGGRLDGVGARGRLALGDVVPVERAAESLRHAELAADVGRAESRAVTAFGDLDAFALLLGHVPGDALGGFADRLLGAVERHDTAHGTDMVATLRAFLDADGQWNRAAAALGVHRHTLRARMDRIAELTGQDLDSGYARAGLWLALRARGLDAG